VLICAIREYIARIFGMVQNVVTLFSTQRIVVFSITLGTTSSYEYFWPSNYPEKCYPWGYEIEPRRIFNHIKQKNRFILLMKCIATLGELMI
jgi:hypothetical protein